MFLDRNAEEPSGRCLHGRCLVGRKFLHSCFVFDYRVVLFCRGMFVFLFLSVFLCFNVGQVLESCTFLSNCNVICFVCFICTFQQIKIK